MYKSKLQVLCQQNHWGLPEYSTAKDGLGHKPRFTVTVTVNGVSFETTDQSRTAKEAQNKAAKLAIDHFSSPAPSPSPSPNHPQPSPIAALPGAAVPTSSSGISQPTMIETKPTHLLSEPRFGAKDEKFIDVRHSYKNRLQNYAQKRNLTLPEYSCECEGPPHASRFKSKVTFNGKTYESLVFFPTIKEAEHAAAKVAWESLSADEVQEDDCGLYKNLLQEFAQRDGFKVPMYDTIGSGPPHSPTFVSIVEIGGKSFQGQATKSKKQAEMSAAKIAYSAFQERCQVKEEERTDCGEPLVIKNPGCQVKEEERTDCGEPLVMKNPDRASLIPTILPSGCQIKQALEISSSILQSVITGDSQQSVGSKPNLVIHEEQDEEYIDGNEEFVSIKWTTENAEVVNRHSPDPLPEEDINAKRHRCSPSPDIIYPSLQDQVPPSSSSPKPGFSSPSASSDYSKNSSMDSNIEPGAAGGINTSPRERILVYPCGTNMSVPDGATVLPFSDDKWVAVKMNSSQQ